MLGIYLVLSLSFLFNLFLGLSFDNPLGNIAVSLFLFYGIYLKVSHRKLSLVEMSAVIWGSLLGWSLGINI